MSFLMVKCHRNIEISKARITLPIKFKVASLISSSRVFIDASISMTDFLSSSFSAAVHDGGVEFVMSSAVVMMSGLLRFSSNNFVTKISFKKI